MDNYVQNIYTTTRAPVPAPREAYVSTVAQVFTSFTNKTSVLVHTGAQSNSTTINPT